MSADPFCGLLDALAVINLDQRPDRWAAAQAALAPLLPTEKLHRIPGVLGRELPGYGQRPWFRGRPRDTTWAGRAGCTLGHRRALETARAQGWRQVLVLEDDIAVDPAASAVLAALGPQLQAQAGAWDICYLGFTNPLGPWRQVATLGSGHSLHEVYGCQCAHAYLLGQRVYDWILERLPQTDNIWPWIARYGVIDRWYRRQLGRHFRVWAVSPSLVRQQAGFSDVLHRDTDYGTGEYALVIPPSHPSPWSYRFTRWGRCLASGGIGASEAFRALTKRLRGF